MGELGRLLAELCQKRESALSLLEAWVCYTEYQKAVKALMPRELILAQFFLDRKPKNGDFLRDKAVRLPKGFKLDEVSNFYSKLISGDSRVSHIVAFQKKQNAWAVKDLEMRTYV
jgi:hypothetical protein